MTETQGDIDPALAQELQYLRKRMDDLMRFQLDARSELIEYKMQLLGQKYNAETGEIESDPNKIQFMNERGANAIVSEISPRAGKIGVGSNISEEEINKRCLNNSIGLAFFLLENESNFEIPSNTAKTVILNQIDDMQLLSMKKSKDGWLADALNKNISYIESREHVQNTQQDKKILFNPFNRNQGGN